MKRKALISHASDEWATPKYIYEQAMARGMYDPCPLGCISDKLKSDWGSYNFVNPPYSQLLRWVEKSIEQHQKGKSVILLIPARTDTKSFRLLYEYGSEITFITGRLRFNEAGPAPFPSMLVRLCGGGSHKTKCLLVDRDEIELR